MWERKMQSEDETKEKDPKKSRNETFKKVILMSWFYISFPSFPSENQGCKHQNLITRKLFVIE